MTGRRRGERGQALMEFALAIPALLLFLCAIVEFGNLLLTQIQIQNAVREGARYAALSGCPADSAIQAKVQSVASGLSITVPSASYSPSPCSACLGVQVPTVTVSGSYTYSPITPIGAVVGLLHGSFGSSVALSSSSTLNNEC